MNTQYISECLIAINQAARDPETAHILEDELYHEFILHVATHGDENLRNMAMLVLRSKDISFPRWCA